MSYDHWKTTNPEDEFLGPHPDEQDEGPPEPVFCVDCDRVHSSTRQQEPWRWCCTAAPIEPGFGFVHPTYSPDPPYEKCSRVNRDGMCQMFEPVRQLNKPENKDAA